MCFQVKRWHLSPPPPRMGILECGLILEERMAFSPEAEVLGSESKKTLDRMEGRGQKSVPTGSAIASSTLQVLWEPADTGQRMADGSPSRTGDGRVEAAFQTRPAGSTREMLAPPEVPKKRGRSIEERQTGAYVSDSGSRVRAARPGELQRKPERREMRPHP